MLIYLMFTLITNFIFSKAKFLFFFIFSTFIKIIFPVMAIVTSALMAYWDEQAFRYGEGDNMNKIIQLFLFILISNFIQDIELKDNINYIHIFECISMNGMDAYACVC